MIILLVDYVNYYFFNFCIPKSRKVLQEKNVIRLKLLYIYNRSNFLFIKVVLTTLLVFVLCMYFF